MKESEGKNSSKECVLLLLLFLSPFPIILLWILYKRSYKALELLNAKFAFTDSALHWFLNVVYLLKFALYEGFPENTTRLLMQMVLLILVKVT